MKFEILERASRFEILLHTYKNDSFFFDCFNTYLIRAEATGATAYRITGAEWIFVCFAIGETKEEKAGPDLLWRSPWHVWNLCFIFVFFRDK